MLDGAAALGHLADHVAGRVLQEDQGRAALVAELDELAGLGRAIGLDRTVVAQYPDQPALDAGVAAHRLGRVLGLEFKKVGAIDQTRNDLAHIVGLTLVGGHQAEQFLLVEQRLGKTGGNGNPVPVELVHHLARHADGVGVVLAQVLAQAGHLRMGFGAADLVLGAVLADGGLDQRRAGQKDVGASAHQDHVIRQARQVGAAGGGRAMHDGDLRQAGGRHARLVGETASALDEDLALVHQIRAAALDQIDQRQLVLARDLLRAQRLAQAHRRDGAALDRAVAGRDQAALARNHADANDGATAEHRLLAVVVVHVEAGQAAELQKRRSAIEQARHALARQQLAARLELAALRFGFGNHQLLQALHFGEQLKHALRIRGKRLGLDLDLGTQNGHGL